VKQGKKRGRPKGPKLTNISEQRAEIVVVKETAAVKLPPVIEKEVLTEKAIMDAFDMLGIAAKLDDRQKRLFVEIARMHRLNPLKRQIHAVPMWDNDSNGYKLVPVTGYEVYIDRAEESGRLEYWRVEEAGEGADFKATVVIKRKDWPKEFGWTARFAEVKRTKKDGTLVGMWKDRPTFMTTKVAIAQGFRLCFRDVLQGMPYTIEEMSDTGTLDQSANIKEPKAMKNVTPVDPKPIPSGPTEPELVKEPTPVETARATLNAMYKKCGASHLFTEEELIALRTVAAAKKDDLQSLEDLYAAWGIELDERVKAKKEKA
jgi:phage recombination protein Bet